LKIFVADMRSLFWCHDVSCSLFFDILSCWRIKCHKHTDACSIVGGKTLLTYMVYDILSIVVGYSYVAAFPYRIRRNCRRYTLYQISLSFGGLSMTTIW
jgi:hypothetical protein